MFDRKNAHVGQNIRGINDIGCSSASSCGVGRRTFLGSDATVAGAPYAPTTIPSLGGTPVNTIGSSAAGTAFMLTFSPKCPVKAVALFMDPDNLATELCALYVGVHGANNVENLFGQSGASVGWIPATAFEDMNACVPLLDAGPATYMAPFILVGRTTASTSATTTIRAALLVDYV